MPYRLGELIEALANEHVVVVVEGERKADLLHEWNVAGTCCAGGSGKWRAEHSLFFQGANVVILPDNDDAGRGHIEVVAKSLQGIAASVRVLELPGLPPKGDVVDWAATGHTAGDLWRLIESDAKPWTRDKVGAASALPGETNRTSKATTDKIEIEAPAFSDEYLALRFARQHQNELRFVAIIWNRWLAWRRTHWRIDRTLMAFNLARVLCREVAAETDVPTIQRALASAKTVAAIERLARADPWLAAEVGQWDHDLDLFNTPEGES